MEGGEAVVGPTMGAITLRAWAISTPWLITIEHLIRTRHCLVMIECALTTNEKKGVRF